MGKRALLAEGFEASGATELLLELRRRTRSAWLPVLTFHRVHAPRPGYLFDDGVIDASPTAFEQQIATLRRYFDPVSLADVLRFVDGGALPNNPVLVTFDDGYLDNHDVALPILQRHGVPAVFFIATHYIEERRTFWWDRVNYLVKTSPRDRLTVTYPRPRSFDLRRDRAATICALLRTVKTWRELDLGRFLDELARAAGVPWDDDVDHRLADPMLMTWEHIRALRAAGMDVQSHTRTHRVLQTLSPADVFDELHGSSRELERQLDEPVRAISYPVGHALEHRSDLRQALRDAGFRLGFTNATGAQSVQRAIDRYGVSRIGIDGGLAPSMFRAMLAAPALFA